MRGALVAGALFSLAGVCGPNPNPAPPDDVCSDGARATGVTTIEIGSGANMGFEVLTDGAVVPAVIGGQGFTMIVVGLRLSGPDVPACVAQTTSITLANGTPLATRAAPLSTYDDGAGRRTTSMLYVPIQASGGQTLTVSATVGTVVVSKQVYWRMVPVVDAGNRD